MADPAIAFDTAAEGGGDTPLTRNTFAVEFNDAGDTIRHHERYALHARKILADEGNFLGLFALDAVLDNKEGSYRRCDITPAKNHPLLLFYQFHALHENDKENSDRKWKYLPDRPDLDKVLALLHDEGEDTKGFTKDSLRKKLNDFIDNINQYVDDHNNLYPLVKIEQPSHKQIAQMRNDIEEIVESFDALTHGYKGEKLEEEESYHAYHVRCLANGRAARVKAIDKVCNAATFVYRNRDLITALKERLGQMPLPSLRDFHHTNSTFTKYRNWIFSQVSTARNLYFSQHFERPGQVDEHGNPKTDRGFMRAAIHRYPENKKFFNLVGRIMETQFELYDHNVANEKEGHGSPDLKEAVVPKYENMMFSPRVNLLQITRDRFREVMRIDRLDRESLNKPRGMFGIPFPDSRPA